MSILKTSVLVDLRVTKLISISNNNFAIFVYFIPSPTMTKVFEFIYLLTLVKDFHTTKSYLQYFLRQFVISQELRGFYLKKKLTAFSHLLFSHKAPSDTFPMFSLRYCKSCKNFEPSRK